MFSCAEIFPHVWKHIFSGVLRCKVVVLVVLNDFCHCLPAVYRGHSLKLAPYARYAVLFA